MYLKVWELRNIARFNQCCGTVTIYFTVPLPTFNKLWFRFWFELLTGYGSGSGSSYGSRSRSVSRRLKAKFSKKNLDEKSCLFQ